MFRTLAFKELRELWWTGAIALFIIGTQIWDAVGLNADIETFRIRFLGNRWGHIPFLSGDLREVTASTACGLAAALGLWQTLGESARGTWPFLLHRPMRRRTMVLSKLSAGLVLLVACIVLPLFLYALWAATPGTDATPFAWWMTTETWRAWFAATAVYLAAFLCGIRDARWYGSRFWPLVPALALPILALENDYGLPVNTMVFLFDVVLLGAILYAVRERG